MMLFSCENSLEKVKQFIDIDTISGVMAYDVTVLRSDSGMVVASLKAPVLHSIENDSSVLEFPKGFFAEILDDTVVTATISADYGVNREKEEMLIAKGNVVVKNMETQEILNTETLFWNQKTKKISTKNMVKITSPDRVVFGDSLTADEDFSKRVIHGIRATIEFEDE